MDIPLSDLRNATNDFSDDCKVGGGRYGVVYKGLYKGDAIAVKMLHQQQELHDDTILDMEYSTLNKVLHRNVVRLIGYCWESRNQYVEYNGELVLCRELFRALCFEYIEGGSLDKHISDESCGLDWPTRHKIIKGTCEGLYYLHNAHGRPIFHLGLNPAHILLDKNMTAKISVFGFSLRAASTETDDTGKRTDEYMPPEYKDGGEISTKYDVFSLGVTIIKIMAGNSGYTLQSLMRREQFTKFVTENWKERLQNTSKDSSQQIDILRVKTCVEIALTCVEDDPHRRPSITEIIHRFEELEVQIEEISLSSNQSKDPARMKDIHEGYDMLECIIGRKRKPSNLKLPFLGFITENFSDELKIGNGGCGVVYKGILRNGTIAVKRLLNSRTIDDKMFRQEVKTMMMVNHKNVVRFLGYCSNTEELAHEIRGEFNMAEDRERLLCFEYISNGSLDSYLTDELRGLKWQTRYQIIRGICDGLDHLHREKHIIHMDLKPANILLDNNMVPKITDFGLSRLDDISHTLSKDRLLSLGYCAPEYMIHGKMSAKSDIYSLGVIILALLTGIKEKPNNNKVHRRWKHRWTKSAKDANLESAQVAQLWYKQVATCLDLVKRCTREDPAERPDIWDVISDLNKMDDSDVHITDACEEYQELEDMLGIEPLELHLPFELNEQTSCFVKLTNDTDDHFAFRISSTSPRKYLIESKKGIIQPRSNCKVTITLQSLEKAFPGNHCRDEFIVQSTRVDGSLTEMDIGEGFFREESDKVVDTVHFTIILIEASPSGDC